MTVKQFEKAILPALEVMEKHLEKNLQAYADGAIEAHRRRMWVRDRWCCEDMTVFAKQVWASPNPPKRDENAFGGVTLELRGRTVNYCPFCGVMVGK